MFAALAGCARTPPPRTTLDDAPPRILSAFFGLDHALPDAARLLCRQAPGLDGMPVTFSRRVVGAPDPAAFAVRTRSGALLRPVCATTRPADGPAKNHTVLLIGDIGREPDDPPVRVEVTGSLPLDQGADARGLSAPVTPLVDGPTLVMALGVAPGSVASDCPRETRQIVVAVWAGGVTPRPGGSDAEHLAGYRVETDGGQRAPFALGDLHDRDNYVHLCLDTLDPARRVSFRAGVVVDPRGDLNPATSVAVSGPP
jgi:hypothetical protein